MWLRSVLVVARHELRILGRDPSPLVIVLVIPLVTVAIVQREIQATLGLVGLHHTSGSEFAVPGQIVTFGFFLAGFTAISFFREQGWGTWSRIRAMSVTPAQIVAGKLLPVVLLGFLQLTVLLTVGRLALGLRIHGSVLAVLLVGAALVVCIAAFGLFLTALCSTIQQVNMLDNAGAVGLAAIGGALVPLFALPAWLHHIAPLTPQYWAMRGFSSLILDGRGLDAAWLPVLALIGFSSAFCVVALIRLRFSESQLRWG